MTDFKRRTHTQPIESPPSPNSCAGTEIVTKLEKKIQGLSTYLDALAKNADYQARAATLARFQQEVEALTNSARAAGLLTVLRLTAVLDAFLKELCAKPANLPESTVHTLSLAVNVLGTIIRQRITNDLADWQPIAVVVDDEHVSSTAACVALRNAGLNPFTFSNATAALAHLTSHAADLVVLDMRMVGEKGFEIYNKLRELPFHHETPAIFVTSPGELKSYSEMAENTDTQILTKPYNMMTYLELALKGLARVLKHKAKSQSPSAPADIPATEKTPPTVPSQAVTPKPANPPAPVPVAAPIAPKPAASNTPPTPEPPYIAELKKHNQELQDRLRSQSEQLDQLKQEKEKITAELDTVQKNSISAPPLPEQPQLHEDLKCLREKCSELEANLSKERESAVQARAAEAKALKAQADAEAKAASDAKAAEGKLAQAKAPESSPPAGTPDRRLRETVASSARLTADLEKERGERRRVEQRATSMATQLQELHGQLKQHLEAETDAQKRITELDDQLRQRDESVSRLTGDLQKEKTERHLAEEQLRTSADLVHQLRNCLSAFEEAKKGFKRTQDDLQARLQASSKTLTENDTKLQAEATERKRLEEALAVAQRELKESTEKNTAELSRLQSALEFEQAERRRLEGDAVQSRYASLDAARANLALLNKVHGQIREPIEQVLQVTCRILETTLEPTQKQMVETVLENALLLESSLQEMGAANAPQDTEATNASEPPNALAA